MRYLILNSSVVAAVVFFWMVRKEIHRELDVLVINKNKQDRYYPD